MMMLNEQYQCLNFIIDLSVLLKVSIRYIYNFQQYHIISTYSYMPTY